MNRNPVDTLDESIEVHVDAYDAALCERRPVNITEFVPDRSDPDYLRIAVELVRVDLEHAWARGRRARLDDYQEIFPELFTQKECLQQIAFEEFRQRRLAGENISAGQYAQDYSIATATWSTVTARQDPTLGTCASPRPIIESSLPVVGDQWGNFEIMEELGRGEFSRVFLAAQSNLAQRQVVLKFSVLQLREAERLARLQHTNIVPIYSVDACNDVAVVCMPFLGRRTLRWITAEVHRRGVPDAGDIFAAVQTHKSMTDNQYYLTHSYEDGVLRIMLRLADALSHAHERGVVHNDIKPANILLSDDGQPMLLDFNLAADAIGESKNCCGTLPYMSPEKLRSFTATSSVDHRSDIYSLGMVFYELLTGHLPFGQEESVGDAALSERRQVPAPSPRSRNPRVTGCVDAMVRRCLSPDARDRYQSAAELHEDLTCQVNWQPLKYAENRLARERMGKWRRRHPLLGSLISLAAVFAVFVVGVVLAWSARERHVRQIEATAAFTKFQETREDIYANLTALGVEGVDVSSAVQRGEQLLSRIGPGFDRLYDGGREHRLRSTDRRNDLQCSVAELGFLVASAKLWEAQHASSDERKQLCRAAAVRFNALALQAVPGSRAILEQQAAIAASQEGHEDTLTAIRTQARSLPITTTFDHQLVAILQRQGGNFDEAINHLRVAAKARPKDYSVWLELAISYAGKLDHAAAESCLTTCLALRPETDIAYYQRGATRFRQQNYRGACADFSKFLQRHPQDTDVLLNRALAARDDGDLESALADVDRAIELGATQTRAFFVRSKLRRAASDLAGARRDFQEGLRRTPTDEKSWIARGLARLRTDPTGALSDFDEALKLNPKSHSALRNRAHVLSERLSRPEESIASLDRLIELTNRDPAAYVGRGVLLARRKRYREALRDAQHAIDIGCDGLTLYQVACVYALTTDAFPENTEPARKFLAQAFEKDASLAQLTTSDPDLRSLQDDENLTTLVHAATRLRRAARTGD